VSVDVVTELVEAVDAVLARGLSDTDAVDAMRPAMARLLDRRDELPAAACRTADGQAGGHLLHVDPAGRYHVMTVVFPPGTSSGIHEHGCWGIIGYVAGLDEETKYARVDGGDGGDGCVLEELARVSNDPGTISRLLPPGEMFHRVRNPGDTDGVSLHVLCHTPEAHPHRYYDRESKRLLPFPFRVSDGLVRAEVQW
jgi:predicted metal-dependent enzyme (double-stranded beta helix superfamily)